MVLIENLKPLYQWTHLKIKMYLKEMITPIVVKAPTHKAIFTNRKMSQTVAPYGPYM